jgi:hypothetical protein
MKKGRQTIGDVLQEAINLLRTNIVINHIKACLGVYMELTQIKGYDPEAVNVFAYYRNYLEHKHQALHRVGFKEKIKGWWLCVQEKYHLKQVLNICETRNYGDGNDYMQTMFQLIRRAL